MLAKTVEKAVQFEVENERVIVRSKPIIAGMDNVSMYAILEALEVCFLNY